jgi:hypothetical protein
MTELEWEECDDPARMLSFLAGAYRHLSPRKLLLFGFYCCRHALHPCCDPEVRAAFNVVEHATEGTASEEEQRAAARCLFDEGWETSWTPQPDYCSHMAGELLTETNDHIRRAVRASKAGIDCAAYGDRGTQSAEREAAVQARWVRELFPSPFRPKFYTRDWFTWNNDTPLTLARQMYDSREFGAMPILADALQDAGCENDDILAHCRDPHATHVRGCWVCDLVLGKA